MREQSDLFSSGSQNISLHGFGDLLYVPEWLSAGTADRYFSTLLDEIPWEQPEIKIYGQSKLIPRLQAWFGDPNARMVYSETEFVPRPWHPLLIDIKSALEREFRYTFNSVLVNLYRNGQDSVSWHADDEIELGKRPVIASVSLGATRKFSLKPKPSKKLSFSAINLPLLHGDLVIMSGDTQDNWHHAILKDRHVSDARINLTFRLIRN